MPGRRDIDQLLVAWLDAEAAGAPPAYLEETLGRLDRTPQRRLVGRLRHALPLNRPIIGLPQAFVPLVVLALLAVAVVAVIVFIGSQRRPAPPIGPAGNGVIVYGDGVDLYMVDPFQQAAPGRLTGGLGSRTNGVFSPDGTMIAFLSNDPEQGIHGGPRFPFVAPADGLGEAVQVSDAYPMWDFESVAVNWSPDSQRLLYTGYDVAASEVGLVVARTDGSGASMIHRGGKDFAEANPAWSPDGRWIAFRTARSHFPGTTSLTLVPSAGGDARELIKLQGHSASFTYLGWSPDSTRIAFDRVRSAEPGDYLVALYDLERDKEIPVSQTGVPAFAPAWSADGQRLAYQEVPPGSDVHNVVIVDRDGRGRLVLPPLVDCWMQWSPDGTYLLGYALGCRDRLVVVRVADQTPVASIEAPGVTGPLSWQRVAP